MFIDIGGKLINASQILWIEPATAVRGTPRSTIRFAGGDTLTVNADTEWLAKQRDEIVPAPAGYQAVRASTPMGSDPDRSVGYDILPVIAFRARSGACVQPEPITPDGILDDDFAIIGPDGRCWDCNGEYADLDAFKATFEAHWAQRDPARSAA